jgi:hypothetical protein
MWRSVGVSEGAVVPCDEKDADADGWEPGVSMGVDLDSMLSCVDKRWRLGDRRPFIGG